MKSLYRSLRSLTLMSGVIALLTFVGYSNVVKIDGRDTLFHRTVTQDTQHSSLVFVYFPGAKNALHVKQIYEDISESLKYSDLTFFSLNLAENTFQATYSMDPLQLLWYPRYNKTSGELLTVPATNMKTFILHQIQDRLFFTSLLLQYNFDRFVKEEDTTRWDSFFRDWGDKVKSQYVVQQEVRGRLYISAGNRRNIGEIDVQGSYVEDNDKWIETTIVKTTKVGANKYKLKQLALLDFKKSMNTVFTSQTHVPESIYASLEQAGHQSRIKNEGLTVSAVIIEPRDHAYFNHVVLNVVTELPSVRPIHIFHGAKYTFDAKIKSLMKNGEILMHRLNKNNLSPAEYSQFMTSTQFWEHFNTDKILVFQTDSVVCQNSRRYELGTFLRFDYIGASMTTLQHGNGGLSVRDRKLSLQCSTPGGFDIEWEDSYFASCILLHGGKMAGKKLQGAFAIGHFLNKRSFGAHQVNRGLLNKSQLIEFRESCPNYLPEMS